MTLEADLVNLLVELDFPSDDVRSEFGALLVDCARRVDAGDQRFERFVQQYLSDITDFPNDPAGFVADLRFRRFRRLYDVVVAGGMEPPARRRDVR